MGVEFSVADWTTGNVPAASGSSRTRKLISFTLKNDAREYRLGLERAEGAGLIGNSAFIKKYCIRFSDAFQWNHSRE